MLSRSYSKRHHLASCEPWLRSSGSVKIENIIINLQSQFASVKIFCSFPLCCSADIFILLHDVSWSTLVNFSRFLVLSPSLWSRLSASLPTWPPALPRQSQHNRICVDTMVSDRAPGRPSDLACQYLYGAHASIRVSGCSHRWRHYRTAFRLYFSRRRRCGLSIRQM